MNSQIDFSAEHRRTPEDSGPPSLKDSWFLHNRWISGPLSHKHLEEETLMEKIKMEEVREMGAPSSYLTELLHIPSFAPGYKRAKPFCPRA
jgi:hypothetical protein